MVSVSGTLNGHDAEANVVSMLQYLWQLKDNMIISSITVIIETGDNNNLSDHTRSNNTQNKTTREFKYSRAKDNEHLKAE